MHDYDLKCLTETWLDSTISSDSKDTALKRLNFYSVDNNDDA